ncbi:MAG: hypothetical protein RIR62_1085 [Pseudomonadota bacterium]|jgi:methyl-accepting chemotaxis protein
MTRRPAKPAPAKGTKTPAFRTARGMLLNDPLDWLEGPAAPQAQPDPAPPEAPVAAPRQPDQPGTAGRSAKTPTPPSGRAKPAAKRTIAMTATPASARPIWETIDTYALVDLLSNPMMIADAGMIIRHVNEAAFRMFERIEEEVRKDLPQFRARDVVGKNIDVFHKNPVYQRRTMDGMTEPHDGTFSIGGAHLGFRATPRHDESGKIACYFVEWRDRTAEVVAEAQLAQMVTALKDMSEAHLLGEIDVMIDAAQFSGVLRESVQLVNEMVQEHINTKKKVVACVTELAQGNLDASIETFNRKRVFLNDAVELIRGSLKSFEAEIRRLLSDMSGMVAAHDAGDIDVFIDSSGYSESYARVIDGMNAMVRKHIETKAKVIDVVKEFANGNFEAPLERFPRKKAFINEAMETVRANFKGLVLDAERLARELADGVLDSTVDTTRHKGQFRAMIDSIDGIRGTVGGVVAEIDRLSQAIVAGQLDVQTDAAAYRGAYGRIIQAFDATFTSLNSAFSLISTQVSQVAVSVEQMSRSSQSLATNAQIQSSSVDEVSASAEQTDVQVKANAAAATTASELVTGASEIAEVGKSKINEMVGAMEGIRVSSQDIAKIIKVIDEIAFQTNLLALNAAVEAARAGQHGRGFAVVAQEVRNLAGRSAKAARETSDLIDDASKRVQAGVRIADETSRAFVTIADDIDKVKTLVRDIAAASGEQARGVAQINAAIGEIAKSALSTSQQAEELAATSAEMQAATESMLGEVSRFRLRATRPATALPPGMLDGLPADLMAQIQGLIASQMAGGRPLAATGTGGAMFTSDRDTRGFANF